MSDELARQWSKRNEDGFLSVKVVLRKQQKEISGTALEMQEKNLAKL